MRFYIATIFVLLFTARCSGQDNIWLLSNVSIYDQDKVEPLLQLQSYDPSDILIFHGNALSKNKNDINKRIAFLRSKFSRVYIVPGDKEWKSLKSKELKSLGDFLDDEYKGDVIVPENSCGAVEVKDISDNLALVFIDSEWYFTNWQKDADLNKKCEITSRDQFWINVADELGKLKAKQVIFVTRHPMKRYDEVGGHYSTKSHLFPLADIIPGLYIPLPLIGTMVNDTKRYLTPRTNTSSPMYREYSDNLEDLLESHSQLTIISSSSLLSTVEIIEDNYNININSSSDATNAYENDILYESSQPHHLRLDIVDTTVVANLYDSKKLTPISYTVIDDLPLKKRAEHVKSSYEIDRTITKDIRSESDLIDYSGLMLGKLNADMYKKTVTVPQLNVSSELGGLRPLRLGGGQQTQSLRFEDSTGHVYLARSLKKRPERALPSGLRYKPLENVMSHFFLSAHPLAFLTVPTLEASADLLHTTPKLMYLPKQEGLGNFNDQIGGEMVLFRERADDDWRDKESFGRSKNIISTSDMITKLEKNKAKVDSKMFLRARLLDLVIGDWDRHQDQWRWAEDTTSTDYDTYFPIARDRDQVYSNFNGLLLAAVRPYSTDFLQMRSFDDHLSQAEIRWMHFKSALLDNTILHNLTEEQWSQQTAKMKSALSPATLNAAMDNLPETFSEDKMATVRKLTKRVYEIEETSKIFRKELLQHGLVRGTDKRDSIVITKLEDKVHVEVYADYQDAENSKKKFDGYFFDKDTDRLWVYGLLAKDVFVMNGDDDSNIDITIIGGYSEDRYIFDRSYSHVHIIDDQRKATIDTRARACYREIQNKIVHDLTRYDLTPLHRFFFPNIAFNSDDGFTIGGSYTWIKTGFKNRSVHNLSASYLTRRQSSLFAYNYDFQDDLTETGRYLTAYWSGPRRQQNYFGGNNSVNDRDRDFYDVNISDGMLEVGWSKEINNVSELTVGTYGWTAKVEDQANTLVTTDDQIDVKIFTRQHYAGGKLGLELANFDSPLKPTQGAKIAMGADYRYNVTENRSNLTLSFRYDYYRDLIKNERLIYSTKVRVGHIIGDYFLYEGLQIGGGQTLRGFNTGRFTGRTMFAHNNNLHYKLFERVLNGFLPSSMGLTASFDHGRVWTDEVDSDTWHTSYGGGLWLSPLNKVVFSVGYHLSREDAQLRVLFNWQF